MIIDYTYFIGKLYLPQTGNTDGRTLVEQFIERYEPDFLKKALGYELWKAFTEGLEGSGTPEQRWIDLLEGAEFTYCGKLQRWNGFARGQDAIYVDPVNQYTLVVDRGQLYDPVAGLTMTLPPSFVGSAFTIELRGTGQLRSDEYSVSGSIVTFGIALNTGATIFLKKGALTSNPLSNGEPKISPIANYVYYQFQDDAANVTSLAGQAVQTIDNNSRVNSVGKMIDAWNEMAEMLAELRKFLYVNAATYPEWSTDHTTEVYKFKNSLDL